MIMYSDTYFYLSTNGRSRNDGYVGRLGKRDKNLSPTNLWTSSTTLRFYAADDVDDNDQSSSDYSVTVDQNACCCCQGDRNQVKEQYGH